MKKKKKIKQSKKMWRKAWRDIYRWFIETTKCLFHSMKQHDQLLLDIAYTGLRLLEFCFANKRFIYTHSAQYFIFCSLLLALLVHVIVS